jgi:hypothetical protein
MGYNAPRNALPLATKLDPASAAQPTAVPKSKYKVILMGGIDYLNSGAFGTNKTLGDYVEVMAASKQYYTPLQKRDIRIVNSPLFGSTTGIYDELIAAIKDNFDTADGTLILYGYSWGGQMQLACQDFFRESKINVSLLITIDTAKGWFSDTVNRKIGDQVRQNLNIYQTVESPWVHSRGDLNQGKNVKNVDLTGEKNSDGEDIAHGNISEYTLLYCAQVITYALLGIYSYNKYSEDEIKKQIKDFASRGF